MHRSIAVLTWKLVIQLYEEANHVPEIKTRPQFDVYSIEGTIDRYPKMKRLPTVPGA
jgi:hypothetical protein